MARSSRRTPAHRKLSPSTAVVTVAGQTRPPFLLSFSVSHSSLSLAFRQSHGRGLAAPPTSLWPVTSRPPSTLSSLSCCGVVVGHGGEGKRRCREERESSVSERERGLGLSAPRRRRNQEIREICKITKTPLPYLFPSQTVWCLIPPVYFVFEF